MKNEEIDWNSMVEIEKSLNKRILSLESDADHITKITERNNSKTVELSENFRAEISNISGAVNNLKIEMKNCLIEMDVLITKIKQSAKKDELDVISQRIENFNAEGLITKYELNRSLE